MTNTELTNVGLTNIELVVYKLKNSDKTYEGVACITGDNFILYNFEGTSAIKQKDLEWAYTCCLSPHPHIQLYP